MSLKLDEGRPPVRVSADKAGCIIKQSKNPEWGFIRVVQEKLVVRDNFYGEKEVSALFHGPMDKLKSMGLQAGDKLIGNIVIKEQVTPFSLATAEKDKKKAGDTGIFLTVGGCPIYRRTYYTTASNVEDTLVQHDNIEELRAAYESQKNTEDVSTSTSESLSETSFEDDFSL
jgi:hypothetical protein